MKEFVALMICTVLIAPFPLQYTVEMVNNTRLDRVEAIVNTAKEQARQEGCFTQAIIDQMAADIETAGFEPDEISITATQTPKYRTDSFDRRELIEYEVGVLIKQKIAANRLFGISDEENSGNFVFKGAVASEKLSE